MTPELARWAARHGVAAEAVAELLALMGAVPPPPLAEAAGKSESFTQSVVRLEAPQHGVLLFRNNVGVLQDKTGRPVRYGLANDSPQMNDRLKSADLIGVRKVTVTASMVGTVIGQFVSRECKPPGWRYRGSGREPAQMAWASLITSYGGDAKFTTGTGSF